MTILTASVPSVKHKGGHIQRVIGGYPIHSSNELNTVGEENVETGRHLRLVGLGFGLRP